jgi:hypothetical protein
LLQQLVTANCRQTLAAERGYAFLNVMRLHVAAFAAALISFAAPAAGQDYSREYAAANELRTICQADSGRLWGANLCGPLLVVNPATRMAWGTQGDNSGVLQRFGDGWVGALPNGVPIANASVDWGGARWAMVMGPLPEAAIDRRVLVMHEAWHRIQQQIGLPQAPSDCAHLETERGRYLLRLEMRALSTALLSSGRARQRASREALAFRAARLREFPAAGSQEPALDRNEGLASYTGVKLGAGAEAEIYAMRTLNAYDTHQAFARSYAYATGPAYGLLLDSANSNWRSQLAAYSPADLLAIAVRAEQMSNGDMQAAAARYDGPGILRQERDRAEAQRQRIAEFRNRFASGPRLELPLSNMQMEFDPNQVTPIDGLGSVYGTLTIRDGWGELRSNGGALISSDFRRVVVALPEASGLSGPGWSVGLTPAYIVGPPGPTGARTLTAPPPPSTEPPNAGN